MFRCFGTTTQISVSGSNISVIRKFMSQTLASLKDMLEKVTVMSLSNQHPSRGTSHLRLLSAISVLALKVPYLGTLSVPGKLEQSFIMTPPPSLIVLLSESKLSSICGLNVECTFCISKKLR